MKKFGVSILIILFSNLLMSQSSTYRLAYRFTDSSMPPDYHRSYEIVIESGNIMFVVDSYGDILHNESAPITNDQLNKFVKAINACKLANKPESKDDGCTGGTSESFSLQSVGIKMVDGFIYYCGGKSYGTLKGNIEKARMLFKSLVPDFEKKLNATRK